MSETLRWWLVLESLGLGAFPLLFPLFRRLPDRGYAFAKGGGLLFWGYLYWLGGTAHLLPNSAATLAALLALVAAAGGLAAARRRRRYAAYLRVRWPLLLAMEALFAASFAVVAFLRSYVPEIQGTEKPMDFAFLNAVLRADGFPPEDPWLAGHGISYYYFGHLMVGALTKLTRVAPAVGFNLGLAAVAALTAVAAFGLLWNLAAMACRPRVGYIVGLGGLGLLLLLGTWEGLFELLAAHRAAPERLYQLLAVQGLPGEATTSWYPTEFWWWWRATRMVSGWTIREFPFFSFLLGDLHAHVMALPFVIGVLGFALALLRVAPPLDGAFWRRRPGLLLASSLLLGSLAFLNAWDFPTLLAVVALAVLAVNGRRGGGGWAVIRSSAAFLLPLAALGVALFAPFYATFRSAASFVAPVQASLTPEFASPADMTTRPVHLLLFWGPLFWVAAVAVMAALVRQGAGVVTGRLLAQAAAPALLPLLAWLLAVLGERGPAGLADEATARGQGWGSLALLAALLSGASLALLGELRMCQGRRAAQRGDAAALFALGAVALGLLLLLGSELFYVNESVPLRVNSVFKLSFQAWILLSLGGAYGLAVAARGRAGLSPLQVAVGAVTAVLLAAGLVYPLTATLNRTEAFHGPRTLDGLAFVAAESPGEREALAWLATNVEGTPVLLEAAGEDWGATGRVSSRTGLPTLVGWPYHEFIWRGNWQPQLQRQEVVERIYRTPDPGEAMRLLAAYGVVYVYVGPLERELYGVEGVAKFQSFLDVAYENGSVAIYRVPGDAAALAGPAP